MLKIDGKMIGRGFKAGLATTWELAKIVVPTTMLVTLFKASGFLTHLTAFFAPYMRFFGLSGEAAVALFGGYFINLYAAAGSILALDLAPTEITVLAVMLGLCHSLLVELPISKRAGSSLSYIFLIRLVSSLAAGLILGVVLA